MHHVVDLIRNLLNHLRMNKSCLPLSIYELLSYCTKMTVSGDPHFRIHSSHRSEASESESNLVVIWTDGLIRMDQLLYCHPRMNLNRIFITKILDALESPTPSTVLYFQTSFALRTCSSRRTRRESIESVLIQLNRLPVGIAR